MGTRVYVGRLPYRANERDIERFFRGYGKIVEVILKNGYGFVEFADYRDADDAVHDLSGRDLMGEKVIIEVAKGTPRGRDRNGWRPPPRHQETRSAARGRSPRRSPRKSEKTFRVRVENLSSKVSWQDLKDEFRSIGEITYATAHTRNKNEGVLEFSSREDMKKAIEKMDGKEMQGRKIKLVEEKSKRRSRSRSKQRRKSRSLSGSRSRSRSRSVDHEEKKNGKDEKRSADEFSGDEDEKATASRKRSRSRSGSESSTDDHKNKNDSGNHAPSPKRTRADSEKSGEGDEEN